MENFILNYKAKSEKNDQTIAESDSDIKPNVPWVEKYRPKSMDDISYQDEVVAMLKKCISGSDIPNLLFYGPPGTGKTSTILAAAKELFGPKHYRDRVLELNASDERGIAVIREKVKRFSHVAVSDKLKDSNGKKSVPALKLIILDEADSMTSAAQSALRRTMEVESKSTRFCLICNYVTRIIDPLTSRCAKFRFKSLDKTVSIGRLKDICKSEQIKVSEDVLMKLVEASEGDLRRAITMLQSASLLVGDNRAVSEREIHEVAGTIPSDNIDRFLVSARSNSFEKMHECVRAMVTSGFAAVQVINQLQEVVATSSELTDRGKSMVFEKLASCDEQLMGGADEYLQLMAAGCFLMQHHRQITVT